MGVDGPRDFRRDGAGHRVPDDAALRNQVTATVGGRHTAIDVSDAAETGRSSHSINSRNGYRGASGVVQCLVHRAQHELGRIGRRIPEYRDCGKCGGGGFRSVTQTVHEERTHASAFDVDRPGIAAVDLSFERETHNSNACMHP